VRPRKIEGFLRQITDPEPGALVIGKLVTSWHRVQWHLDLP